MSATIGLFATTATSMPHVLGIGRAAQKRSCRVEIFLSGDAVHLTQDPSFPELLELGRVAVCEVSYLDRGYERLAIPGLVDRDFVTQGRNAELVGECDRYLVL